MRLGFPRLFPPIITRWFWRIVIIVAIALYGGAAFRWFFDGPGEHTLAVIADLKLVFILVVALGGGGLRLAKRAVTRSGDGAKGSGSDPHDHGDGTWPALPDGSAVGERGIGGTPPAGPVFVNPSRRI